MNATLNRKDKIEVIETQETHKIQNSSERIDVQTTSTKLAGNPPDLPPTFPVHLRGNPVTELVIVKVYR